MSTMPKSIRFTETHEWIDTNQEVMTVGITEHAQELLGDMVFVELPQVDTEVHAGDELGVLESVKAASDFYAPISGIVVAINEEVVENPALINRDPYGAGWLVKIRAHEQEDLDDLLSEEEYQNEITEN
jgi:glycine cleavage system H protein